MHDNLPLNASIFQPRPITAGGRYKKRSELKISIAQAANSFIQSRQLTSRDEAILQTLYRTGVLTRHQIQRLFWPDSQTSKTVSMRLDKLVQRHLLNVTPDVIPSLAEAGMEPCYVYTLGSIGEEILAIRQGKKRKQLSYGRRYAIGRGAQLIMHDVQTAEVLVQAVVYQRTYAPDLKMKWANKKTAAIWKEKGKKSIELVRPDGGLTLKLGAAEQAYFIEMDRGNTRWEKKVASYESACAEIRLKTNRTDTFPIVLAIVPRQQISKIAKIIQQRRRDVTRFIMPWSQLLTGHVFDGWRDIETKQFVSIGAAKPIYHVG